MRWAVSTQTFYEDKQTIDIATISINKTSVVGLLFLYVAILTRRNSSKVAVSVPVFPLDTCGSVSNIICNKHAEKCSNL